MSSLQRKFSHIYVESAASDLPRTRQILERFPKAQVVHIDDYKEVFNRPRQNWALQKKSRKLIVAKKKDGLAYECGEIAPDFGFEHFYYNALMFNCVYDCSYCYLQGMYPSANIVIFTNLEDYFEETDKLLEKHSSLYLCISYDTDLLALNDILPYAEDWIEYASQRPELCIELRTKSVNIKPLLKYQPSDNVVIAWTISPASVSERFERLTPSLDMRLKAIKKVMDHGWKVRLCFDPILKVKDWESHYSKMLEETFSTLPPESIRDASVGTFRMNSKYLKQVKKIQSTSEILYSEFEISKGVSHYPKALSEELTGFVYERVKDYLPNHNVVITT